MKKRIQQYHFREIEKWLKENTIWHRLEYDKNYYYIQVYSFKDGKTHYYTLPRRADISYFEILKNTIIRETRVSR